MITKITLRATGPNGCGKSFALNEIEGLLMRSGFTTTGRGPHRLTVERHRGNSTPPKRLKK